MLRFLSALLVLLALAAPAAASNNGIKYPDFPAGSPAAGTDTVLIGRACTVLGQPTTCNYLVPVSDFNAYALAHAPGASGQIAYNSGGVLTTGNAATIRGLLGLAAVASSGAYADLTGKPTALSAFANDTNFITAAGAPVQSVNSQSGAVTLTTSNIAEGSNLYYTNGRADARIAAAIGATIQGWDADLDAAAALSTTGYVKRTGAATWSTAATIPYADIASTPDLSVYALKTITVNGHALSSNVTVSASDITTGTLPAAQLPNPSATTLGGVQSVVAAAHNFLTSISTSGVPAKAQPACGDLSNAAASCSTDATNAANISAGNLSVSRLNSGTGASATTAWFGDGSWKTAGNVSNTGAVTSRRVPVYSDTTGSAIAFSSVGVDASGNITGAGTIASGAQTITSASSNALAVGPNGTTNPALQVDGSVASSATGVGITPAAAGSGVTLTAISSGGNETLTVQSKGSGTLVLRSSNQTGSVGIRLGTNTRATFTDSTLTYNFGGVSSGAGLRYSMPSTNSDTGLTGGTETPVAYLNMGGNRQHALNTAISLQRDFRITGSTHSFAGGVGTGTITDAATLGIDGGPNGGANAKITNSHGLYISTIAFNSVTNGYGLTVNAPTGATNNFAANLGGVKFDGSGNITGAASIAATSFTGALTGNAATATALQTPRTINGTSFDGTANIAISASSITTGTLPAAQLPNPSATTLGGVQSVVAAAHNFLTSISTSGVPAKAQPACGDLSDAAASCNTDATNAANIASGTLPAGRLPALTGDITSSAGAAATTLATVNANTGSFGSSTAIPNFTTNGKGLVTAAGTNAVIAPAGTLTGATLASGVTNSSITTLGSSASLPGNPTTTTQAAGNSSTRIATTAFAASAVKADTRCYDLYFTTPGGSVEPTGSNPPPAFKDFPFGFTISQIYLSVYTLGAGNAAVNGGFSSNSVWTLGSGVTIDTVNTWAVFSAVTGAGLTQTPPHALTPSWPYTVTYTISGYSAGSVAISVGGTAGASRSADGTYTETITSGSGTDIVFTGSGFTGNISAVSATSYATFDIQNNGVSILDASRLAIDNAVGDSRNNAVNSQPNIILPTILSTNTLSVVVIKDDDQNAMAGGDMVICGSKP